MPGYVTPAHADQLLKAGVISPETHAMLTAPVASAAPPVAPPDAPAPAAPTARGGAFVPFRPPEPPSAAPPAPNSPLAQGLAAQGLTLNAPGRPAPESAPRDLSPDELRDALAPPAPIKPTVSIPETTIVGSSSRAAAPAAKSAGGAAPKDPRRDALSHQTEALTKEQESQAALNNVAGMRAAALAQAEDEHRAAMQDADTLEAKRRADDDARIEEAVGKRAQAIQEYSASSVDPEKYWKDRSDADNFGAALGIALGAFAEGWSGGKIRNTALDIVNRDIDRTIAAQEKAIELKKGAVDMAGNSIATMRQLAGDRRSAALAERIRLTELHQAGIAAQMAKYDSQAIQINGQKTIDALEAQKKAAADQLALTMMQEERARAAAAAAQARARDKELFERGVTLKKLEQEGQKIAVDEQKANKVPGGAGEDAALKVELESAQKAWEQAVRTLPSNRIAGAIAGGLNTDSSSQHEAALATLGSALTTPGERSDADYMNKVRPKLPKPNDDEETLARKKAALVLSIAQKHPAAWSRMSSAPKVATTKPPGG